MTIRIYHQYQNCDRQFQPKQWIWSRPRLWQVQIRPDILRAGNATSIISTWKIPFPAFLNLFIYKGIFPVSSILWPHQCLCKIHVWYEFLSCNKISDTIIWYAKNNNKTNPSSYHDPWFLRHWVNHYCPSLNINPILFFTLPYLAQWLRPYKEALTTAVKKISWWLDGWHMICISRKPVIWFFPTSEDKQQPVHLFSVIAINVSSM